MYIYVYNYSFIRCDHFNEAFEHVSTVIDDIYKVSRGCLFGNVTQNGILTLVQVSVLQYLFGNVTQNGNLTLVMCLCIKIPVWECDSEWQSDPSTYVCVLQNIYLYMYIKYFEFCFRNYPITQVRKHF